MWYVMQVRAGNEAHVAFRCRQIMQGDEEVFIPRIDYVRRIRGVEEQITRTMFPGYVFFETTKVDDLFYRLKSIKALTKILKTGDEFSPLPYEEVEIIRRLGGDEHLVELSTGYKEGNRVVITEGPLKDFGGNIIRIDRHKRNATIAVPILGEVREIKVGLRVLCLEEEMIPAYS